MNRVVGYFARVFGLTRDMPAMPEIRAGDVLFTRGENRMSRIIIWACSNRHRKAQASHQAPAMDSQTIIDAIPGQGVTAKPWATKWQEMHDGRQEWAIYRRKDKLDEIDAKTWEENSKTVLTWRYSVLELPLQLADMLVAKLRHRPRKGWDAIVFRRLGDIWAAGVICSKTANWMLRKIASCPHWLEYGSPDETVIWMTGQPDGPNQWGRFANSAKW